MGVFWLTGKKFCPKKSERMSMHILSDFLERGFQTSEGSATSDNTSDEEISACSHGIRHQSFLVAVSFSASQFLPMASFLTSLTFLTIDLRL